jgi:hypothetical protein
MPHNSADRVRREKRPQSGGDRSRLGTARGQMNRRTNNHGAGQFYTDGPENFGISSQIVTTYLHICVQPGLTAGLFVVCPTLSSGGPN